MADEPDLSSYPGMTKWFSPRLLIWAAYRDAAASIFGEFADRRTTQHLADPIPAADADRKAFATRYDYSGEAKAGEPFWADFVADLGDGFDSTYAVAYLVSADKLYGKGPAKDGIAGLKGLPAGQELPHGRLLMFGGDQIYPWPDREAYDIRTFKPYELALPEKVDDQGRVLPASRDVFAIPGNHDWYDGLDAFDAQFCRARAGRSGRHGHRFGDFQTCQHRGSFAIKLPYNWWIWGADIQLSNILDSGQLDYFTAVAECMGEGDKLILLTAEPSWYRIAEAYGEQARRNLRELIKGATERGVKLCGILTGDSHHYSRYNESKHLGNMNLITAGGGGAYMHGTYHLDDEIKFAWFGREFDFKLNCKLKPDDSSPGAIPKQTNARACYPSKQRSRLSALNAFKFPANNISFCVAVGMIYWLMTWTFATLRVDAWLTIPQGGVITRGLTQSPQQLRECLKPPQDQTKLRKSRATKSGDVTSCILGSENGLFTGTGTVEEWTLQTMEFFVNDKPYDFWKVFGAFRKGYHLLLIGVVNSIFASVFLFAVLVAFFIIAKSKYKRAIGFASRMVQAVGHLIVHLSIMWGLYSVLAYANYTFVDYLAEKQLPKLGSFWQGWFFDEGARQLLRVPMEFWARIVYPFEMIVGGGLLGAWAFAIYLSLAYGFGKVNFDWVFSSQRIANYKNFLRMRFEPDKLTIYPIGLDRVPSRNGWRWKKNPAPRQARVEPVSPLEPRLIEGPIVIRSTDIPDPRLAQQMLAAAGKRG